MRKPRIARRTKAYTSYFLTRNIDIPMAHGRFKVVTTKDYVTRRQWFDTKGRLFMKCLCYNVYKKKSKIFKGKKTINYVSAEYPHVSRHKKLIKWLCYNRASWEHIQKGGSSNPVIEVLDWIIKYQTFYNVKTRVPYLKYSTKRFKRRPAKNIVLENTGYSKGFVRFKTLAETPYIKPSVNQKDFLSAFKEFMEIYYPKDEEDYRL